MTVNYVWGVPDKFPDPPKFTLLMARQDALILTGLINKYSLIDSIVPSQFKLILGKQIGYNKDVVTVVSAGLDKLPEINPGPMTPTGMTDQSESIEALIVLRAAADQFSQACGYSINARKGHLWDQTTTGAAAITEAADEQKNRSDRNPLLMDVSAEVQRAVQQGLIRAQNTVDGKAKAVDAVQADMQAKIDALLAQNEQLTIRLAATEKALATEKGNTLPGGSAAPPATHHKPAGHGTTPSPVTSIPVTPQRKIQR